MKIRSILSVIILALFISGCASTSVGWEFWDIDELIEASAWEAIDILWDRYDDLESADSRTMAVYYFTEGEKISSLSDYLIQGLTTEIANAINWEGIKVNMVSRQNLDRIIEELAFQSSDLADEDTQLSIGKQLGADIILTGTVVRVENTQKINAQLIEVETGVVLGGFLMYMMED